MQTRPFTRIVFATLAVVAASACSSSGGTGGCGALTLPGGFPRDQAVENAGGVRLTRPGLDFMEAHANALVTKALALPTGVLEFNIPPTTSPSFDICPDGPVGDQCKAEINLGKSQFRISAVTPNAIKIDAVMPLVLKDTPVLAKNVFLGADLRGHIGYGSNGSCNRSTVSVDPFPLPVSITLPLVAETTAPRDGYTKIDVDNATVNLDGIRESEVRICVDCSFASSVCNGVVNSGFVKGYIVDQLKGGLGDQVKNALRGFTCTKPAVGVTPTCPNGSKENADKTYCVYNSTPTKCVPTLLGTAGHTELGALLASFSPGAQGGLDYGFAAGKDMEAFPKDADPRKNGATLHMFGGVIPQPISNCVPTAKLTMPTDIPTPTELTTDKITPWSEPEGPHVGIGFSGRFLNYTFGNIYNSGVLCLGVNTDSVPLLNTGLVSALVNSVASLTKGGKPAPLAITTRPQQPPTVKLGGGTDIDKDPLMTVTIPKFSVDLYVWSYDRFIRAFTYTGDISLPINLTTKKDAKNPNGGLLPTLGKIGIANATVTNADLLADDPKAIASGLTSIISGFASQLLGGFSPIDLSTALQSFGLNLTIPDGGIRKLTKDSDDFIGIFANLSVSSNAVPEGDTTAKLVARTVDKAHMNVLTIDPAKAPEVTLLATSTFTSGAEYSYILDDGTPSEWQADPTIRIVGDALWMQGKHRVRIASRKHGAPASEDSTPAEVTFLIDALAPNVTVDRGGDGKIRVSASDFVSEAKAVKVRTKLATATEFGAWQTADLLEPIDAGGAEAIDVEAVDEDGNLAEIHEQLVRGRPDATLATASGSGCGCTTMGDLPSSTGALPMVLGGLAFALRRRRRGAAGGTSAEAVVHPPVARLGRRLSQRGATRPFFSSLLAATSLAILATSGQACSCGSDETKTECGTDCNSECVGDLAPGLVGAYTSVAKAKDGTVWVAGYNDGDLATSISGTSFLYGDLVVGKYDLGRGRTTWETVDGVGARTAGCSDYAKTGWRKGETESGDDVGQWTSMQLADDGVPMVAYFDATHGSLKFATRDGVAATGQWTSFVVQQLPKAEVGRYAKMVLDGGKPTIAYQVIEATATGTKSRVVLARAKSNKPSSAGDFSFEDVAFDDKGPCQIVAGSVSCSGSDVCVKSTGACTKTVTGCQPACASGKACVTTAGAATCVDVATNDGIVAYPNASGTYVASAVGPKGIGLVAYDRVHGNLVAFTKDTSKWTATILDGETGSRSGGTAKDTGDTGVGASLFIDGTGAYHVTYVDGISEQLRYVTFSNGKADAFDVVDDGNGLDGKGFADGKHVVGDDSTVLVDGTTIRVFYQDATAGTLRMATGVAGSGGKRTWTRTVLDQTAKRFGGYFPQVVPGGGQIAHFWRQFDPSTVSMVGDVTLTKY
jgi:MYXO-CTERM domain-containing protein